MNPGDLVNAAGVVRNNWIFEYYRKEGYTIQLTPSNDLNQVIRDSDGVVVGVFSRNDSWDLVQFMKAL